MKRFVRMLIMATCVAVAMMAAALPALAKSDMPIVVTMGDSYASGEGIEPYYGQEDGHYKYWNQNWVAHRATRSYASYLTFNGTALGDVRAVPSSGNLQQNMRKSTVGYGYGEWTEGSWYNVSVSAACLRHVYKSASSGGTQSKSIIKSDSTVGDVDYTANLAPQITVFDYLNATYGKGCVDYVTITVGGYDCDFPMIVANAALTSSSYTSKLKNELAESKENFYKSVRNEFKKMFYAVREAAGPQANIIFIGYPPPFDGYTSGNAYFNTSEMKMINDVFIWYDTELQRLVLELNDEGFDNLYYLSLVDAFKGHGAYASDNYVFPAILPAREEDIDESGYWSLICLASIHPNEKGAQVTARELQKLIDEIELVKSDQKAHVSGLARENGSYCYYDENGVRKANTWIKALGDWYYLGEDGMCVKNTWMRSGDKSYYLDKNGKLLVNAWLSENGSWYYFGSDGDLATNGWIKHNGNYYYAGESGAILVDSWIKSGGSWYYLGQGGKLVVNGWVKSSGSYYYMGSDGKLVVNGWVKYNGSYYYMGSNGKPVVNGWVKYNGKYYYMGSNGKPVVNGWVKYNGAWYYFNGSGVCTRKVAA